MRHPHPRQNRSESGGASARGHGLEAREEDLELERHEDRTRRHQPPRPGDCASGLELPSSWPRWQRPAGSDPNMHRVPSRAHPSADGSVAERLLDRTQGVMKGPDLTSSGLLMEVSPLAASSASSAPFWPRPPSPLSPPPLLLGGAPDDGRAAGHHPDDGGPALRSVRACEARPEDSPPVSPPLTR